MGHVYVFHKAKKVVAGMLAKNAMAARIQKHLL